MDFMVKASAPGSLMLAGEHAVLRGYPALCAAVDVRIHVSIKPLDVPQIMISSDKFGTLTLATHHAFTTLSPPFHFIGRSLARFTESLDKNPSRGLHITIHSDFQPTLGLGSSAALTVALLFALHTFFQIPFDKQDIALMGRDIIQESQKGLGSGADVMASVFGGVVYYQMDPFLIEPIAVLPPMVTIYSGNKTPTAEVIAIVQALEAQDPIKYQDLFSRIGKCVTEAKSALLHHDWIKLGAIFNEHAALQEALGVSNERLREIQQILCSIPSIFGAKISGSGLGDCVVGIGTLPDDIFPDRIPVCVSLQGVCHES